MKENRKIMIIGLVLLGYLLIGTYLYGSVQKIDFFDEKYGDSIISNYYFRLAVHHIYFILFGLALGFGNFYDELTKDGKWTIQWRKILIQGLPMLYIGFHFIIYFATIRVLPILSNSFFIQNEYITILALVASGYILITSIKRDTKVDGVGDEGPI